MTEYVWILYKDHVTQIPTRIEKCILVKRTPTGARYHSGWVQEFRKNFGDNYSLHYSEEDCSAAIKRILHNLHGKLSSLICDIEFMQKHGCPISDVQQLERPRQIKL